LFNKYSKIETVAQPPEYITKIYIHFVKSSHIWKNNQIWVFYLIQKEVDDEIYKSINLSTNQKLTPMQELCINNDYETKISGRV